MKRLKISINGLLGLVFLVAVDCVTVRLLRGRPEWGWIAFLDFPMVASSIFCLPMANLVAIGGSRILVRRVSSRGFWIGATIFATLADIPLFVWQGPGFYWFESKLDQTE